VRVEYVAELERSLILNSGAQGRMEEYEREFNVFRQLRGSCPEEANSEVFVASWVYNSP
jgi:hypothetical protein